MKNLAPPVLQTLPIALRREQAAAALGMSVSLFEREVTRGNLPKPRKLADRTTGWLYDELKAAAVALPVSDLLPPATGARRTRAAIDPPP
jgi:prophage regulatory protein